jgi:hypothetical protein
VAYQNVGLWSLERLLSIQLRKAGFGCLGVGSRLDRRRQAVANLNLCATTASALRHIKMA